MKAHKWIVGARNKINSIAIECDSAAAIEGAKMTPKEREELQKRLREIVKLIDSKIYDE